MISPSSAMAAQGEYGITISLFSEFLEHPPRSYFEVRDGPGYPLFLSDKQKITVCVDKAIDTDKPNYFPDSNEKCIKVHSLTELEDLSTRLLTNPIFTVMKLSHEKQGTTTKGKYVVMIWPQHPDIQPHLQRLLKKARKAMEAGKHFAYELDLKFPVSAWFTKLAYGVVLYTNQGSVKDVVSDISSITVTSRSSYAKCYSCNWPDSLCLWMCCFPCCLLTCPCYRIQRCLTVKDYRTKMTDDVPVGYQCLDPNPQPPDESVANSLIQRMRREAESDYKVQYAPRARPTDTGATEEHIHIQPCAPFLPQGPYIPPTNDDTQLPYNPHYHQPNLVSEDPEKVMPPPPSYDEAVEGKISYPMTEKP